MYNQFMMHGQKNIKIHAMVGKNWKRSVLILFTWTV